MQVIYDINTHYVNYIHTFVIANTGIKNKKKRYVEAIRTFIRSKILRSSKRTKTIQGDKMNQTVEKINTNYIKKQTNKKQKATSMG